MTADAITRRLRRDDVLARLGGDEFAVLLPGLRPMDEAARVALDLAALIAEQRFVFDGVERARDRASGSRQCRRATRRPRCSRRPIARCTPPRPSAAVAYASHPEVRYATIARG